MNESTPAVSSNMRSLDRAIDVLEVLDNARHPLRLSEIARRSGLHIATAKRILAVLEARGRVEHDEAGYRPGLALLFGAHAYLASSPLVIHGRPVVQALAAETGFTASLFARSGLSRAVVERVEGTSPMRYILPTGERLPLTLGAGKVIAAYMTHEELNAAINSDATVTAATSSRQSREDIETDLELIRTRGFHVALQERAIGVGSVASPVLTSSGECIAGVQIAARVSELDGIDIEHVALEVRRAAARIAQNLG